VAVIGEQRIDITAAGVFITWRLVLELIFYIGVFCVSLACGRRWLARGQSSSAAAAQEEQQPDAEPDGGGAAQEEADELRQRLDSALLRIEGLEAALGSSHAALDAGRRQYHQQQQQHDAIVAAKVGELLLTEEALARVRTECERLRGALTTLERERTALGHEVAGLRGQLAGQQVLAAPIPPVVNPEPPGEDQEAEEAFYRGHVEREFSGKQLTDVLKKAGLAYSGSKKQQAARIGDHGNDFRRNRSTRQQLVYVSAVMRRGEARGLVPHISVIQNKDSCRLWLSEHGDWNR